jgi:glycosyltransferase involved in cell wall biosynthesis
VKIVHLSAYDSGGGAAKSAYRLHEWMIGQGYESTFVVRKKRINDSRIIQWGGNKSWFSILKFKLTRKFKYKGESLYRNLKSVHQSFAFDFRSPDVKPDFNISGDILQVHWIIGFLDFNDIVRISSNFKYVVWRFSDLNPATGGCVINDGCEGYLRGCVDCPINNNILFNELVVKNSNRKKNSLSNIKEKVTIISQSSWMKRLVQDSYIFKGFEVEHIPNGIFINNLVNKMHSDDQIINVLAVSTTFDTSRTGIHLLQKVCRLNQNIRLELAGGKIERTNERIKNLHYLGSLRKDELYKKYSQSDVLIFLNKQDNFPNVLLEAGMHGLPVIAFRVDGVTDIIIDGYNGWLFEYGDLAGISHKLTELTRDKLVLQEVGLNARKRIEESYDINIQGNRYIDLYKEKLKFATKN